MTVLARLEDAIARQDWPASRRLALELWRATRSADVGELVDRLGPLLRAEPVPRRSDATAFERLWLERAAEDDDGTTGALAASLAQRPSDFQAWPVRIARLRARPVDPRVGIALATIAVRPPSWLSYGGRYRQIFDGNDHATIMLLHASADVRAVAILRQPPRPAITYDERSWLRTITERCLRLATWIDQALVDADAIDVAALIATVEAAVHAQRGTTTTLLAQVHTAPDDDDLRAVLADALLEIGEPRGEMMSLSLRQARGAKVTAAMRGRMNTLVAEHEAHWLGPAALQVLEGRIWRRGMLDEATLVERRRAGEESFSAMLDEPRLATLRVLHLGRGTDASDLFVLAPRLPGLRALGDLPDYRGNANDFLEELARCPLHELTELVLSNLSTVRMVRLLREAYASVPSLVHLRLQSVPLEGARALVKALVEAGLLAQLEDITLEPRAWFSPSEDASPFLGELAKAAHPPRITLRTKHLTVVATRGERGLDVEADSKSGHGLGDLAALSKVDRLVIRAAPERKLSDPTELAAMLKKIKAREVELPKTWAAQLAKR